MATAELSKQTSPTGSLSIDCDREKLLHTFQTAATVAPTRSPKPILQNVKIEASPEGTVLQATDLEVAIRVAVAGVEASAPGAAVLPIQRFGAILRESPDAKLHIEANPQGTLVRGERSEFKLPGEDPMDFPPIPSFGDEKYHEISARFLREVIRRTSFATDTESGRYALGGVLFELEEKKLTAVGTDGRRLAKMEGPAVSVGGHATGDQTTIIPTKALHLLERALSDSDANVQLAVHANEVLFRTERVTISSLLVEGRFPKWRDVFPKRDDSASFEVPVGPFYSAVRQAAIVTSEESKGVEFTFGGGKVVLAGKAAETGQSRIELPLAYDGPEISVMLDPKYLAEFLKVLDAEKTFTLDVKDAEGAAVATTDDGYGYVIMPMARDR